MHMSHRTWPPSDNCFKGASLVRILAISSSACVPGQKTPLQTESSPYIGTPVLDYIYTTIFEQLAKSVFSNSLFCLIPSNMHLFTADARFSKVHCICHADCNLLYYTYRVFTLTVYTSSVVRMLVDFTSVSSLQLLLPGHRMLVGMLLTLKAFSSNGAHRHLNIRMD